MADRLKILLLGQGGREHALVETLACSPSAPELWCWPGSDGIFQVAQRTGIERVEEVVPFMRSQGVTLCVVGEEKYLALGVADAVRAAGMACWGPGEEIAQLESSKRFAKEFMHRHGVPTGSYRVVENQSELEEEAENFGYPVVLKYSGLAAGKGVAICRNRSEVEAYGREVFEQGRFGDDEVLVEEYLEGPELSLICAVVDEQWMEFPWARDYKRLGDGDSGPNTGGMGSVASVDLFSDEAIRAEIMNQIVIPTVAGISKEQQSYRGFLYFGIMLTSGGAVVLEYNCRMGDPEAQVILPLQRGDFAQFLWEGAQGRLVKSAMQFASGYAVGVVLATGDYPAQSRRGESIAGLEKVSSAKIYHAGTNYALDKGWQTNGGRVLCVVGLGESAQEARKQAYEDTQKIQFQDRQYRRDIAATL